LKTENLIELLTILTNGLMFNVQVVQGLVGGGLPELLPLGDWKNLIFSFKLLSLGHPGFHGRNLLAPCNFL